MPYQNISGAIQWSIIIPAYNEAARILPYLRNITSYMQDRGQPYEILVVDDGSTDATASVVETFASSAPETQLLRAPLRRGKGAAVRRGMQAAVGRLQLFTDADGATPIQELTRLERLWQTEPTWRLDLAHSPRNCQATQSRPAGIEPF